MGIIGALIGYALWAYLMLLLVRMVVSWVELLQPSWRPRGVVLVVLELVYSITDPAVRLVNRLVPSVRIGGVRLDLGFMVLWFAIVILMQINSAIFFGR